ncbi:MAG: ATP-binding protein [Candidatus Cloacimonetes bacterium]|nr:ATP-binding protein [Candidatus Cloacimonadota bacterium]
MDYPRNLCKAIEPKLQLPEALFILGPRQSGKTTLLKQLMHKVGEDRSIYIDLEFPELLRIFSTGITEILKYLNYHRPKQNDRIYVFIDEVQYLSDFSHIVKLMVDHYSGQCQLVMSGSSSALIKYQFKESLVGRKLVYELFPLSFDEYLRFREEDKLSDMLVHEPDSIPMEKLSALEDYLQDYIIYGGYPKVVKQQTREDKRQVLTDIVNSYILKDIKDLFKIEKSQQLNHLVRYLAANIGKCINQQSLATETRLHRETIQAYLNILEECYIIRRLQPFYQNLSTELKKMNKLYFVDTGVRNLLIDNLNELELRSDKGELVENYMHSHLFHNVKPDQKIRYWQTRSHQEIDFIVTGSAKLLALETKYSGDKSVSFAAFKRAYPDAVCKVVCMRNPNPARQEIFSWQAGG